MEKRLLVVLSILLLVLPLASADYELSGLELCALFDGITPEECLTLEDEFLCNYLLENEWADTFYDAVEGTCVFIEVERAVVETPDFTQNLSDIEASVSNLNTRVAALEQKMADLEINFDSLSQRFTSIDANFKSADQQLSNQFNTGLAGLQQEVSATQVELAEVGETAATSSFLVYFILIVLIIAVGAGIYYFVVRKKKPSNDKLVRHISQHIRRGRPHQEIKAGLHQAGWSKSVVDWAHQKAVSSTVAKRNKILAIVVGSVILIGALLFLVSGTSFGKAIYLDTASHELRLECEKELGKIKVPGSDVDGIGSCCSDANGNGICDIDEEFEAGRATVDALICLDNKDCVVGKHCINKECKFLYELSNYDCPKTCTFVSATISTSDGETYHPVIGRGGYTAAGALDWTILDSPEFCTPNKVVLPVEIVKKRTVTEKGKPKVKIISKKVILLKKGQTSYPIGHISVPNLAFTLTVDDINTHCG